MWNFKAKVEQSLATFSRKSTDDESGVEEFISTFRYCQLNTANVRGLSRFVEPCKEA